jgi:hypothetical protein
MMLVQITTAGFVLAVLTGCRGVTLAALVVWVGVLYLCR